MNHEVDGYFKRHRAEKQNEVFYPWIHLNMLASTGYSKDSISQPVIKGNLKCAGYLLCSPQEKVLVPLTKDSSASSHERTLQVIIRE